MFSWSTNKLQKWHICNEELFQKFHTSKLSTIHIQYTVHRLCLLICCSLITTWNNFAAVLRPSSLPMFWVSAIWLCIAAMLNRTQTRSNDPEAMAEHIPQRAYALGIVQWQLWDNYLYSLLVHLISTLTDQSIQNYFIDYFLNSWFCSTTNTELCSEQTQTVNMFKTTTYWAFFFQKTVTPCQKHLATWNWSLSAITVTSHNSITHSQKIIGHVFYCNWLKLGYT